MNQSFELLPFGGAGEQEGELEQERYMGRLGYRSYGRYGARPPAGYRYGARRTVYGPGARAAGYRYGMARPAYGYGRTHVGYRYGQARPGYRFGQTLRPLLGRSYMALRRPYIGGYYGAMPTIPLPTVGVDDSAPPDDAPPPPPPDPAVAIPVPVPVADAAVVAPVAAAPVEQQEFSLHSLDCKCPRCHRRGGGGFDMMPFGAGRAPAGRLPFSPAQEHRLAMELLSVSNEAELEQFLGGMFKGIWNGVKKVAAPLGGALKSVAKAALPMVGGALGSMIPIPGVGTALGTALGGAVSRALEMEFEGMLPDEMEYETARRFVRLAGTAAQLAGQGDGSMGSVRAALSEAARRHAPYLARTGHDEEFGGRWRERGPHGHRGGRMFRNRDWE